jgi:hypothetical protein
LTKNQFDRGVNLFEPGVHSLSLRCDTNLRLALALRNFGLVDPVDLWLNAIFDHGLARTIFLHGRRVAPPEYCQALLAVSHLFSTTIQMFFQCYSGSFIEGIARWFHSNPQMLADKIVVLIGATDKNWADAFSWRNVNATTRPVEIAGKSVSLQTRGGRGVLRWITQRPRGLTVGDLMDFMGKPSVGYCGSVIVLGDVEKARSIGLDSLFKVPTDEDRELFAAQESDERDRNFSEAEVEQLLKNASVKGALEDGRADASLPPPGGEALRAAPPYLERRDLALAAVATLYEALGLREDAPTASMEVAQSLNNFDLDFDPEWSTVQEAYRCKFYVPGFFDDIVSLLNPLHGKKTVEEIKDALETLPDPWPGVKREFEVRRIF